MMNKLLLRIPNFKFTLILTSLFAANSGSYAQQCTDLINELFLRASNPPAGWTSSGILSDSWNIADSPGARFDALNDYFVTPFLETPGTLSFTFSRPSGSAHSGSKTFKIQKSANGTSGWVDVASFSLNLTSVSTSSISPTDISAHPNNHFRLIQTSNTESPAKWTIIQNFRITDASTSSTNITMCNNTNKTISCGTTYKFRDPGGLGDYLNGNNVTNTVTISPSDPTRKVKASFTSFSLTGTCSEDWLRIYNGAGTSSLLGCYSGSSAPPVTISTAGDGALTFVFNSGNTLIGEGWEANVTCINPLPVTLTNFSANCENYNAVELHWSTSSEQNSTKFIVEKSRELHTWIQVDEIIAAGNSNQEISYTTTDTEPYGDVTYYRLIQIDLNGDYKIYGPISIPCQGEINGLTVFPNPSKGDFSVGIHSDFEDHHAVLEVINTQGQIVDTLNCNLKKGINNIPVNGKKYSSGLYLMRLVDSRGTIYGDQKLMIEW